MELYKVIVPTLIFFFLKESLAYFDDSKLSQCADYCRKNENLKITPESYFFLGNRTCKDKALTEESSLRWDGIQGTKWMN